MVLLRLKRMKHYPSTSPCHWATTSSYTTTTTTSAPPSGAGPGSGPHCTQRAEGGNGGSGTPLQVFPIRPRLRRGVSSPLAAGQQAALSLGPRAERRMGGLPGSGRKKRSCRGSRRVYNLIRPVIGAVKARWSDQRTVCDHCCHVDVKAIFFLPLRM